MVNEADNWTGIAMEFGWKSLPRLPGGRPGGETVLLVRIPGGLPEGASVLTENLVVFFSRLVAGQIDGGLILRKFGLALSKPSRLVSSRISAELEQHISLWDLPLNKII